jgi:hypothetical protein
MIVLCCLFAVMLGCTSTSSRLRDTAQSPVALPVHRPGGFVLVREYVDSVKTAAGDEYLHVQYGWNYDQGVAFQRISKLDGTLISQNARPSLTLATTPDELAYAIQLVREHPTLKAVAARADALIYGGFIFTNDSRADKSPLADTTDKSPLADTTDKSPLADTTDKLSQPNRICIQGSRCIHVIISGGNQGQEPLAHAIVDLARGEVVDANYHGDADVFSKIKS